MAEPVTPRPSATVMIARDGANGMEIFMVARDRQVDFASGAVVFPGGKVDPDDHHEAWQPAAAALPAKGPESQYWIAAVRETFEESGLLIAERSGGGRLSAADVAEIGASHRARILDGSVTFSSLTQSLGLVPAFSEMVHFAYWVTPVTMPKRFETHFFLVHAPEEHVATHDGQEAVRSFWISPRDLVAEADAGRQVLVPATRANLELLAESKTVADALAAARQRSIVPVMPVVEKADGGVVIKIRDDAGYRNTSFFVKR